MTTVRRRVVVSGRVQGVGFRWSTRAEAVRIGVVGDVRNADDGTVVVHLEGPRLEVEAMLDWLRYGPPEARVDALDVSDESPQGATSFDVVG